jgi:phospholipid/cholesterol/gamma-HCH transport system substrate-binding protein
VTGSWRALAHSQIFTFGVAAVVVVGGVFAGVELTEGGPTYPLHVVYASAPGQFPGAALDVLGVQVGTVTSVQNVGDTVHVGLQVATSTRIPSAAVASLVAPQLLGEPDVDLEPGYTGGPHLLAGAVIPESRTAVPVSTDEVLKEVQHTLNALSPHAVGELVGNLAQDLDGQGTALNKLIASAAGTISLLADKGNDLGQLNGTLAQLTGTLDADTSQIEQLVQQYDTVSGVLATHSGQLNSALTQLTGASSALVGVLTPNLQPLEADVGTVTTVGRTLDRNLSSVDEILQQGNNLFQGASRAYDDNYNWLDLNLATSPGVTGAYVSGLIRDRLAGICRRIVANHAAGLTSTELSSLNECGNPSSGFFDALLADIPTVLNSLSQASAADTTGALLQKGLNQILNIEPAAGGTTKGSSGPPNGIPSDATTTTTVPAPSSTTTTTAPGNSKSCSVLSAILGCPSGSSSADGSSGSGLGGLLSQSVHPTTAQEATATLAAASESQPSLTAAAARFLPALRHHGAHRPHRGLLAQWAHDVGSWL